MRHFLNVLRVVFHPVIAVVYVVALAAVIVVYALSGNVLNKDQVKSWVNDAGIYSRVTPNIITLAENPETEQSFSADIEASLIDNDAFYEVLDTSYSPSYLFTTTNQSIDKVYDRLQNGQSEENAFRVDASDRIEIFSDQMSALLKSELEELPACSKTEVEKFGDEFDPLTISCVPEEGFSLDKEIEAYITQLRSEGSFLNDIGISDEDIFGDGQLQNTHDTLGALRAVSPIVVLGLVVMFIISAKHPFAAMRNLGYLSIVVSIVVGIGFLAVNQFGKLVVDVSEDSEPTVVLTAEVFVPIVQNAIDDITSDGAQISIFSTLLGIILIAIHYIIEKTRVGDKLRGADLYKKFAGSHAVSIADISAEANKSEDNKKQMMEDIKKVKKMKDLASDNEHTVDEIAKAASSKKKSAKKKPAPKKTTAKKTAKKKSTKKE